MTAAPERMCAACRTRRPKHTMLRFVRDAEGIVCLDETGKRPGRGAYLCGDAVCIKKAKKSRTLEHALKGRVPAQLWEGIERKTDEFNG